MDLTRQTPTPKPAQVLLLGPGHDGIMAKAKAFVEPRSLWAPNFGGQGPVPIPGGSKPECNPKPLGTLKPPNPLKKKQKKRPWDPVFTRDIPNLELQTSTPKGAGELDALDLQYRGMVAVRKVGVLPHRPLSSSPFWRLPYRILSTNHERNYLGAYGL